MSDLQTPRPMDERRKTYLRLIAEICIAIVSVAAVALLAVFAAVGVVIGRYRDGDQKTRERMKGILERISS